MSDRTEPLDDFAAAHEYWAADPGSPEPPPGYFGSDSDAGLTDEDADDCDTDSGWEDDGRYDD